MIVGVSDILFSSKVLEENLELCGHELLHFTNETIEGNLKPASSLGAQCIVTRYFRLSLDVYIYPVLEVR